MKRLIQLKLTLTLIPKNLADLKLHYKAGTLIIQVYRLLIVLIRVKI